MIFKVCNRNQNRFIFVSNYFDKRIFAKVFFFVFTIISLFPCFYIKENKENNILELV